MVKTHMGWAKRAEEKVKKEIDEKKRAQEEQKARAEQARHAAQLNAMLRAAGVPPGLGKGYTMPPGMGLPLRGFHDTGKGKDMWQGMDKGMHKGMDNGKGQDMWQGMDKGKGKSMDSGPKPTPGHKLPRDPVPDLGIIEGTVIEWRGKFGWIKPSEPVHHELARKHGGKIYISSTDLVDCHSLQPGDYCQFLLYKDDSGLGAESCSKIESMTSASEQNWNSSSDGASAQRAVGNWGAHQGWDASSSAGSWEQSSAQSWSASPEQAGSWEDNQAQSWSRIMEIGMGAEGGQGSGRNQGPSWQASTSSQSAQSSDASSSIDQHWDSFLSAVSEEPGLAGS